MSGVRGKYLYDSEGNIVGATGGLLAKQTNYAKHGEDFYKKIGAIGGKWKGKKGFAADLNRAREAGRLGGLKSRRKKRESTDNQDSNQDI